MVVGGGYKSELKRPFCDLWPFLVQNSQYFFLSNLYISLRFSCFGWKLIMAVKNGYFKIKILKLTKKISNFQRQYILSQNKEGILLVATLSIALYVLRRHMSASDVAPKVAILLSAL